MIKKAKKVLSSVLSISIIYAAANNICFAIDPNVRISATDERTLPIFGKKRTTDLIEASLKSRLYAHEDRSLYNDFIHWRISYNGQNAVENSVSELHKLDPSNANDIPDDFPLKSFISNAKTYQDVDAIDIWGSRALNTGFISFIQALAYIWINTDISARPDIVAGITKFSDFFKEYFKIAASYNMLEGFEELPPHVESAFPSVNRLIYRIMRAFNVELQLNMMWFLEARRPLDLSRVSRVLKNANAWLPMCLDELER